MLPVDERLESANSWWFRQRKHVLRFHGFTGLIHVGLKYDNLQHKHTHHACEVIQNCRHWKKSDSLLVGIVLVSLCIERHCGASMSQVFWNRYLLPWKAVQMREKRRCLHGRPQKFFQGGAKSTFSLSFTGCWRFDANWRIQKMSNVTTTIAYSAFLVRKLYTEQMFVLVSMDILWLS